MYPGVHGQGSGTQISLTLEVIDGKYDELLEQG